MKSITILYSGSDLSDDSLRQISNILVQQAGIKSETTSMLTLTDNEVLKILSANSIGMIYKTKEENCNSKPVSELEQAVFYIAERYNLNQEFVYSKKIKDTIVKDYLNSVIKIQKKRTEKEEALVNAIDIICALCNDHEAYKASDLPKICNKLNVHELYFMSITPIWASLNY